MIAWLGETGAGILYVISLMSLFGAGLWATAKIVDRAFPNASEGRSCLFMAVIAPLILVALFLLFGPAIDALRDLSCRSANDREACLDPPDRDWL